MEAAYMVSNKAVTRVRIKACRIPSWVNFMEGMRKERVGMVVDVSMWRAGEM